MPRSLARTEDGYMDRREAFSMLAAKVVSNSVQRHPRPATYRSMMNVRSPQAIIAHRTGLELAACLIAGAAMVLMVLVGAEGVDELAAAPIVTMTAEIQVVAPETDEEAAV